MNPALNIAFVGAAYSLGCLTAAYYLVKWRSGQDVRERHSGTVGATNAGRLLGPGGFILTFVFDCAKGAVAVWCARQFFPDPAVAAAAMLAVVVGHIWPAQLGFRGGKGLSTAIGAMAVFSPWTALAAIALIGVLWALMRRIKPTTLLAVGLTPLAAAALHPTPLEWGATSLLVALLLGSHRMDIAREWRQFRNRIPSGQEIKPS